MESYHESVYSLKPITRYLFSLVKLTGARTRQMQDIFALVAEHVMIFLKIDQPSWVSIGIIVLIYDET